MDQGKSRYELFLTKDEAEENRIWERKCHVDALNIYVAAQRLGMALLSSSAGESNTYSIELMEEQRDNGYAAAKLIKVELTAAK